MNVARELCGVAEADVGCVVVGGRTNTDAKFGTWELFDAVKHDWTVYDDEQLNPNEEYICLLFSQTPSLP